MVIIKLLYTILWCQYYKVKSIIYYCYMVLFLQQQKSSDAPNSCAAYFNADYINIKHLQLSYIMLNKKKNIK